MAIKPERFILTYEDYLQLPDDRNRYEILEGQLLVTPPPSTEHQNVVTSLAALLFNDVRRHRSGKVLVAPCAVQLSDITVVEPDILFVSRPRMNIILESRVDGPPDLVVEVLSPSTAKRDTDWKRQTYAYYGVPNYWVIDPDRRELVAYVLESADYREAQIARQNEELVAAPFSHLRVPLAELWD